MLCYRTCGNGFVEAAASPPETCDPNAPGFNETTCDPNLCVLTSTLPSCGDGIVTTPDEQCEPPSVGNCDATCLTIALCGNGVI